MSAPQGTYDTTFYVGARFRRRGTLRYKASGLLWDLTGLRARMHMRDEAGTLLMEWISVPDPVPEGWGYTEGDHAHGLLYLGGDQGWIDMDALAAATAAVPPGVHRYDLMLYDADGEPDVLWEGTFEAKVPQTRT